MKRADRVFAFIGLGLSCWLILESLKFDYMTAYTPGPGFHPFWLGVCLGLLSLALMVNTFRRRGGLKSEEKRLPEGKSLLRVGLILMFTAGFALSMTTLGFIPTVLLFVFLVLFVLENYTLFKSILYSCIMSGTVFLIFRYWLNVDLPRGWLGL
jgi:hypothetical protein